MRSSLLLAVVLLLVLVGPGHSAVEVPTVAGTSWSVIGLDVEKGFGSKDIYPIDTRLVFEDTGHWILLDENLSGTWSQSKTKVSLLLDDLAMEAVATENFSILADAKDEGAFAVYRVLKWKGSLKLSTKSPTAKVKMAGKAVVTFFDSPTFGTRPYPVSWKISAVGTLE